jgi:hypothetical protein
VVIDMRSKQIVWQYGHTDLPGTGRDALNTPDGMDFVPLNAKDRPLWAAVHHP